MEDCKCKQGSAGVLLALLLAWPTILNATPPLNVLLLIVDDLRPEIPSYGRAQVHAPNMERFAREGLVFHNAYANVPVCGASRGSLLTGLRPTRTRFVGYQARMDVDTPKAQPLFGALKDQGYRVLSLGKVAHVTEDFANLWSRVPWNPESNARAGQRLGHRDYLLPENLQAIERGGLGPPLESADVVDHAYFSGQITEQAVRDIAEMRDARDPFFLAIGLLKPHLPFNAPQKYWNLYRVEDLQLPRVSRMPLNAPREAWHDWGELRYYDGIPPSPEPLPDALARTLIHGYYASVSYVDALVGRILRTLEENGLSENTIIVLLGDHGWSLGEHGLWAKHSTFDVATRSLLIMKVPGRSTGHTQALVEFVDIYPTLMDLLGLDIADKLHGQSFAELFSNGQKLGKDAVYMRWLSAEAIKTPEYALTEWFDEQGDVSARMLFDHLADREETINLAGESDYEDTVEGLHRLLIQSIRTREVID